MQSDTITQRVASLKSHLVLALIMLSLTACAPKDDADRRREGGGNSCSCRPDDQDIESLRQLVALVDRTHYGGSFPDDVPLRWASGPSEYYAYTSYNDRAIYFVRPNFRQDWTYNIEVVMHEMAHFSVGPRHAHDAVWKREFTRLKRPATTVAFKKIRARSAR